MVMSLSPLLLLLSVTAAVSVSRDGRRQRPTLDEWEGNKTAAAAAAEGVQARGAKLAAVNKAVQLLESLKTQVLTEGEAEAATYNKFACFCHDTSDAKHESISKGEDEKSLLLSDIDQLMTKRDTADTLITTLLQNIATLETEMKTAVTERQQTNKKYLANTADLQGALFALEGAIKNLKVSKTPSFAQMQSMSKTVRSAVELADALGLGGPAAQKATALLLQEPADQLPDNKVEFRDYKFHSDSIISVLEGLEKDFKATKASVDQEEVVSVQAHNMLMQAKTHEKLQTTKQLEETRKTKSELIADIASLSQQLTTVEANLMDDKAYAQELSEMCSNRAKIWDQRTRVRADELATLTQAISIITSAVKGNTTAATIRFAQQGVSMRLAQAVAADSPSMRAIEAEAEETDSVAVPMLLQEASERRARLRATAMKLLSQPESVGREAVVRMLRSQGKHLQSALLSSLASQIASGDPFAKVKQLIQELIERLLQEAANQANQKGWCDKATADAKQKRGYAEEELLRLSSEMARMEAVRDRLNGELDSVSEAISDLMTARTEAETTRREEKAENAATEQEAKDGLSALEQCITMLDQFYKTIAKETALVQVGASRQVGPLDDAPDVASEAYTGSQSEVGGILGMLDVMRGDFARTVSMTQTEEMQQQQAHLEFMTVSGKSLAEKQETQTQKTEQRNDVVGKYSEADSDMVQQSTIMNQAVSELMDLKPACVDTGMSYNDRKGRRQQEIESLNQALCILDKYAQYGYQGDGAEC